MDGDGAAGRRIDEDASAAAGLPRSFVEGTLDLLPTPVLLIEPGTARVTFSNRAADALAGGEFPKGAEAERYHELYHCTDAAGQRIPNEGMPGVRAARGERLDGFEMDWHLADGPRSLIIWADTLTGPGGEATTVLVFEDLTALREAEQIKDETIVLLDTIFSSAPIGLAVYDRDLRFVRVNDALAEINGRPAREHAGRELAEVLPGDLHAEVAAHVRSVLDTGQPVVDVAMTGETPARLGIGHWLVGYYPVRHPSGEITGVGAVVREETERVLLLEAEREARRRAAFLAQAGDVLSASLDYEETLRRVARAAVPDRADWCVVDMLDANGSLDRLAVAHTDPAKERWAAELQERYPPDPTAPTGVFEVMRTGKPELHEEISDELLTTVAQDEEHLALIRELGLSSAIIVPLTVRSEAVGAVTFILADSGRHYGTPDLELAMELARRASVAIENARLYRERNHIAQTLQRSLLPPRLPDIEGFDIATRYRAAGEGYDVGGDFYDAFQTRDGPWAMVVGDVCGKGPEAAGLTSLARYTIRAAALVRHSPAEVLAMTNEVILRERTGGHFVSAVHAWVDPGQGALRLASAGHPAALVVRAGGTVEEAKPGGTLLGIHPDSIYENLRVALAPGDAIVLYTDGVLDAGAPERVLESEELAEVLAGVAGHPAAELAELVENEAIAGRDRPPRDDLAILVLRRTESARS